MKLILLGICFILLGGKAFRFFIYLMFACCIFSFWILLDAKYYWDALQYVFTMLLFGFAVAQDTINNK